MQGVILAGGSGTRLSPLTQSVNKHLLPLYDKPMIYYPLTTLILAGVDSITIVTNVQDIESFKKLLGDGSEFGIEIRFSVQDSAIGLPDAIRSSKEFLQIGETILVILGDNIFYGSGLGRKLKTKFESDKCHIFTVSLPNPENFGVLKSDAKGNPIEIIEKPTNFISNEVVTGLYHFPNSVFNGIDNLEYSSRGELEISDLINDYLFKNQLKVHKLERGTIWFDGGTVSSLSNASEYVKLSQDRLAKIIGSPHEAALISNKISSITFSKLIAESPNSHYWDNLRKLSLTQFAAEKS